MELSPGLFARRQHTTLALIARRARPYLLLLDEHYRIVHAEWDAGADVFRELEIDRGATALPIRFEQAVRTARARVAADSGDPGFVSASPRLIARISHLTGTGGSFIAIWAEASRRREDLADATRRFGFTRREQEVLLHMLGGRRASEIATALSIAEGTVGDHFKALIKKTRARNRAEMVARVLDRQRSA